MKRVLIAEDNPDLREIFVRTLQRGNFDVEIAENGLDAIESIIMHPPDLLVLDMNMPKLSGFDVLACIRQQAGAKNTKVIVVTGNCVAAQSPEAQFADLLLVKPVSVHDLITFAERLTN